jgi:hypothetical protein
MIPDHKDLEKISTYSLFTASKIEYDDNPARVDSIAKSSIRQKIANHIAQTKIDETFTDDSVEYRLDLIVCTPKEFWMLVNEWAEYLAHRYK